MSDTRHNYEWDDLREFGPVHDIRFDPHPLPQGIHPGHGVMYTATDPVTPYAEVFYKTRSIDRKLNGPVLTGWIPTRPLTLLNLTSNWPVLNQAAAAMQMTDDKSLTQEWARAIFDQLGTQIDGLYHLSSITNKPMITLFHRAKSFPSFPAHPEYSTALDSNAARLANRRAKNSLGYTILRLPA